MLTASSRCTRISSSQSFAALAIRAPKSAAVHGVVKRAFRNFSGTKRAWYSVQMKRTLGFCSF